jgi:hypothetical protein
METAVRHRVDLGAAVPPGLLHEGAHVRSVLRRGDPSGRQTGRRTPSPVPAPPHDGSRVRGNLPGSRSDPVPGALERPGPLRIFRLSFFFRHAAGELAVRTFQYLLERGFGDEYALTLVRT